MFYPGASLENEEGSGQQLKHLGCTGGPTECNAETEWR